MAKNKDTRKGEENKNPKKISKPGDIKGKIDVPDLRERRDGPGGN